MPRKKNYFSNQKPDIKMMSNKTSTLNDNVQNASKQQNLGAVLNMPRGAKKPENAPK